MHYKNSRHTIIFLFSNINLAVFHRKSNFFRHLFNFNSLKIKALVQNRKGKNF